MSAPTSRRLLPLTKTEARTAPRGDGIAPGASAWFVRRRSVAIYILAANFTLVRMGRS